MSTYQQPARTGDHCGASFRRRVRRAFGNRCEYCGYPGGGEVDRIIPRTRGGRYTDDNVTLACSPCNSKKGDKDFIGPVRTLAVMEALHG